MKWVKDEIVHGPHWFKLWLSFEIEDFSTGYIFLDKHTNMRVGKMYKTKAQAKAACEKYIKSHKG
jgi:hypothetical protein